MRRALFLVAILLWPGCAAAPKPGACVAPAGHAANLALGSSADNLELALLLTDRSPGPAIETGYRFDDLTYYSDWFLDQQQTYDENGGFFRSAETFRTATLAR